MQQRIDKGGIKHFHIHQAPAPRWHSMVIGIEHELDELQHQALVDELEKAVLSALIKFAER
jgi:hypothetical protein